MNVPAAAADKFLQALLLHRQGRTAQAEALSRDILRAQPRHPGALHILGVAAAQSGRHEEAIRLIRRSLAADPNQPHVQLSLSAILLGMRRFDDAIGACDTAIRLAPEQPFAHYNRGTALAELNRPLEAIQSLDKALQLKPDHVQALHNRGTLLARMGRLAEALESYDRALQLMPHLVATLHNKGNALETLKRHAEALDSYERALRQKPDFVEALTSRGSVLHALHRLDEALASFEQALRLRPGFTDAWNRNGRVLQDLKRYDAALASYDHVLSVEPGHIDALLNRANVLRQLGRYEEALDSCDRAMRIRPDMAEALNVRGNVLHSLKRNTEALDCFDAALRLRHEYPEAWHNRGNTLRRLGRLEEALASLEKAIQLGEQRPQALASCGWALLDCERYETAAGCLARVVEKDPDSPYALGGMHYTRLLTCDWTDYQRTVERLSVAVAADKHAAAPFVFTATLDAPDLQLRCARNWTADRFPPAPKSVWKGERYEHDRIRVAYVSPDLREHVVGQLVAPLIERHDRERFEIIGISVRAPDDSPIGQRVRAAFDRFYDVSGLEDDQQAAALLREHEVDIAVDLGGFTSNQRSGILAHRGAPVQVSYLGYPGTLGAEYMHYLLADPVLIPESERGHYSESIAYLPECYQVNHAERPLPQVLPTRQECGLPEQGLVLCSFNNSFKLTPPVFDVWMRLLRQLPDSVLWLAGHRPSVVQNLRAAAVEQGIAPERLIFAERRSKQEDHLVRYALADLFLDTFPFNAHATASDALWYAVPVVTCVGRSFASRVAASLLHTVGLPELITNDPQSYEAKVLEIARSPETLARLREHLASTRRTHALFDTDRFRRHLESAYRTMWERHQRGEPPATFAVESAAD